MVNKKPDGKELRRIEVLCLSLNLIFESTYRYAMFCLPHFRMTGTGRLHNLQDLRQGSIQVNCRHSRILDLAFLGIGPHFQMLIFSTETLIFRLDLTAEIADTLILLMGLHFAGVLEAHIHTVYLHSLATARK